MKWLLHSAINSKYQLCCVGLHIHFGRQSDNQYVEMRPMPLMASHAHSNVEVLNQCNFYLSLIYMNNDFECNIRARRTVSNLIWIEMHNMHGVWHNLFNIYCFRCRKTAIFLSVPDNSFSNHFLFDRFYYEFSGVKLNISPTNWYIVHIGHIARPFAQSNVVTRSIGTLPIRMGCSINSSDNY